MKKVFLLLLVSIIGQAYMAHAQLTSYTYTFNNLNVGNLNGQDNWSTVINTSGTADLIIGYNSGAGTSNTPDLTLGAFYDNSGGNYGRTASRTTTTALPFNFSQGGVVQFEADINTPCWGAFFGFGYDKNNNGYIIPGIEQTCNVETGEGGVGIYISECRPNLDYFIMPNGSKVSFTYDSMAGWNHYKIFIDLDANSGAGAASMSIRKPGGNYVSIAQVQNLNLGLTPSSGTNTDPATWTKLFLMALGGYTGFDNITISQPNTGGKKYQYLTFRNTQAIRLSNNPPFYVSAFSSQGLPVSYTISGPATMVDTTVTLTGQAGTIQIIANQVGNSTVAPATPDTISIDIIDPKTIAPQIDIKNPVNNGTVHAARLDPILLSAATSIGYADLISVASVYFLINGDSIPAQATTNGYYRAYWTPTSYGNYTLTAKAVSSYNVVTPQSVNFQVVSDSTAQTYYIVNALDFANVANQQLDTTLVFPSFSGTYNKVVAYINYQCPPGGCNAYDVIGEVNTRGANGNYVELIRYITPFGIACSDTIDLTDYISQLQGKIDVQVSFPAMSQVTITLQYSQGEPAYKYSWMDYVWNSIYQFGQYITPTKAWQPVPKYQVDLTNKNIISSHLRLVSTGHGWGADNTDNAAEFYDGTHVLKMNGVTAFTQHLWETCNPNPASTACKAQNGTWTSSREGWCPGSVPMRWRFDLTPYLGTKDSLYYQFDTTYVDLCSPFNPNCTSKTCSNCNNTLRPDMVVAGEVVSYYKGSPLAVKNLFDNFNINLYPNPSSGTFYLVSSTKFNANAYVQIFSLSGALIQQFEWNGNNKQIDLSSYSKGMYLVKISNNENGFEYKKVIVQ